MIALGALLIVVGARISFFLPGYPVVPVTLQTFGVLFGSALLGFRRALAAVVLYLILGIAGLPVFALNAETGTYASGLDTIVRASGGLGLAPTGGYLIGFVLAAGLVGRLAELGWDRRIGSALGAIVIGNVAIYVIGVPWLMAATHQSISWAMQNGLYPYIPGDVLKLLVVGVVLAGGWSIVRRRAVDG